jgi:SAM-dependent methyltransferase
MLTRRSLLAASAAGALRGQGKDPKMFADAEAYDRFMGRWSRLVAPLVDLAALPDGGPVLDVGSGTGALSFEVVRRKPAFRVTGVDPSKEYVAYATSKSPGQDRARFEVGDAQSLTYGDATFAASVSLLVFNFIPDPAKALREVRRVTRPGGPVAAAVWDYGDRMRMLRVFWDAVVEIDPAAGNRDEKHMPLCRQGELSKLWKEGGLEGVREQALEITTSFESFADFWDPFLLGQGPAGAYVRALPPDRVLALRNAVKRRLSIANETARFNLPARVWAVRGTVPARP